MRRCRGIGSQSTWRAAAACALVAALLAGCGSGGSSGGGNGGGSSSGGGGGGSGGGSAAAQGGAGGGAGSEAAGGSHGKASKTGGLTLDSTSHIHFVKVPSSAPTKSGLVKIAYRDIAIDPDAVRVKVGSTIEWTNYDSVKHNVVSEGGPTKFSSPEFGEGGKYELKVTKPGVIHYECTLEPTTMNGTIEVVE